MTSRTTLIDVAAHMRNVTLCHAFLQTAKSRYPDLLANIRSDAARAMSGWLELYGYRPSIQWSDEDDCFIGCVRNAGSAFVSFHGKTPIGLQQAFEKAVRDYVVTRAEERHSSVLTPVPASSDDGVLAKPHQSASS